MWPPVGVVFVVCLMVEILLTVIPQVLPLTPPPLCPLCPWVNILPKKRLFYRKNGRFKINLVQKSRKNSVLNGTFQSKGAYFAEFPPKRAYLSSPHPGIRKNIHPCLCPLLADVSIVTRSVCRISEIIG